MMQQDVSDGVRSSTCRAAASGSYSAARTLLFAWSMRGAAIGVVLGAIMVPMSVRADIAPRVTLSVGADAGSHRYAGDSGSTIGVNGDAELRLGMFTIGGSVGYEDYAVADGVPLHAGTFAGRAGVAVPLTTRNRAVRTVQLDAIGALEAGLHRFSPDGEHKDFLFGGSTSYRGDKASIGFVGARIGAAMTIQRANWRTGMVLKLELIGRRDLAQAELGFDRVSCGGLFSNASDCSTSHGMTNVGGTELGMTSSFGIVF